MFWNRSIFKVLLLNDGYGGDGTSITYDDENPTDNIGNLKDVSDERGLNKSFATVLKLKEDKEDTKELKTTMKKIIMI